MRERHRNISAGLLALVSVAVIACLAAWFARGAGWTGGGYTIDARFDRAPGVRTGTPVTVGGIPVGRVRSVRFADPATLAGGVTAEITLDRDHRLRRGAIAHVVSAGLGTSRVSIELDPGGPAEPPLEHGSTIRGEATSAAASLLPPSLVWALERSTEKLGAAVDSLTPLLNDAQRIVEPRNPAAVDASPSATGNLSSAIARLDAAARNLNDVFGDERVRSKIREGIDNLHAASADSRKLVTDAAAVFSAAKIVAGGSEQFVAESRAALTKASLQVDETTGKLNRNLDLMGSILAHLDPVASKIGRGEGTLGKLAADDRLYETLLLSLRRSGEKP